MLAEFLVQYAISTGDICEDSIIRISKNFIDKMSTYDHLQQSKVEDKTGKSSKEVLFENIVMPEIIQKWGTKLNLNRQLSLKDFSQILSAVSLQSQNNEFRTHSFNSAILPYVEQNGLDISRELFKEELEDFATVGCQPFKTGVLNTCELSQSTFGYASIVPERIRNTFTFGDLHLSKQENETLASYLKRNVDVKLEKNNILDDSRKLEMRTNAYKIIDFYYGHTLASVAVIKEKKALITQPLESRNSMLSALSTFLNKPETQKIFMKLTQSCREQLITLSRSRDPHAIEKLDEVFDNARTESLEQEQIIQQIKSFICGYALCRRGLNNFTQSLGTGYDVAGGKIDRSQFAIATYDDPYKLHSLYKSMKKDDNMEM